MLVERSPRLGPGALGDYAIRSDTTAETFLSAVRGNPYPQLAALETHPAGRMMAAHCDALGHRWPRPRRCWRRPLRGCGRS